MLHAETFEVTHTHTPIKAVEHLWRCCSIEKVLHSWRTNSSPTACVAEPPLQPCSSIWAPGSLAESLFFWQIISYWRIPDENLKDGASSALHIITHLLQCVPVYVCHALTISDLRLTRSLLSFLHLHLRGRLRAECRALLCFLVLDSSFLT